MKKPFLLILFFVALLLVFPKPTFSQVEVLEPPSTLEQVKTQGSEFLRSFPGAIKSIFPEALAVLKKTSGWLKNIWNSFLSPWFKNIWKETGLIVKQKKPVIQEELKKEQKELKEEIKTELPGIKETGKSLWQKLKDLIK